MNTFLHTIFPPAFPASISLTTAIVFMMAFTVSGVWLHRTLHGVLSPYPYTAAAYTGLLIFAVGCAVNFIISIVVAADNLPTTSNRLPFDAIFLFAGIGAAVGLILGNALRDRLTRWSLWRRRRKEQTR